MKFRALAFALLVANTNTNSGVFGFRSSSDGNKAQVKNAVGNLLREVKPVRSVAGDVAPPLRNQILGTEVPCLHEYWSRPDIHTFGNMGFGGAFHAAMAPLATKLIDLKAYDGVDVRKKIS